MSYQRRSNPAGKMPTSSTMSWSPPRPPLAPAASARRRPLAEDEQRRLVNVGLFFHAYPHCSVNATHLHIVDLDYPGPTLEHLNFKNLKLDDCIKVLTAETKAPKDGRKSSTWRTGDDHASAPSPAPV